MLRPWFPTPQWILHDTLFSSLSSIEVAAGLRRHGYHAGLQLPARLVAKLHRHAAQSFCQRDAGDSEWFLISQVRNGRSPLGQAVTIADVDASACPAVALIAGDAALVEVAKRHLGYQPRRVETRLYWRPASPPPTDESRRSGQAIDYHYDLEPARTLCVYFFLSGPDGEGAAAHAVVAGSHRSKPLRMMWKSTRQPEPAVLRHYGTDRVVVLEGKPGFGFFEDPACFHKALPPSNAPRLVLRLRYS